MKPRDCLSLHGVGMLRRSVSGTHLTFSIGKGWQARARRDTLGYELECWDLKGGRFTSKVPIRTRPGNLPNQLRSELLCIGCDRPRHALFAGGDHRWYCSDCLGLEKDPGRKVKLFRSWKEESEYNTLWRKFSAIRALELELVAIESVPLVEFFQERSFLIPPLIDRLREINPKFYWRSLERLKEMYQKALRRWAVTKMRDIASNRKDWLFAEVERRLLNRLPLKPEEAVWLTTKQGPAPTQQGKPLKVKKRRSFASARLDSSPPEITSLSERMSSSPATSAPPVVESALSPAPPATARERVQLFPMLDVRSAKESGN
jgi:hypothetical protein